MPALTRSTVEFQDRAGGPVRVGALLLIPEVTALWCNNVMASTLCPYCSKYSHVTPRWGRISGNATQLRFAATCDNCSGLVIGMGVDTNNGLAAVDDTVDMSYITRAIAKVETALAWLPLAAEAPEIEDVPVAIARAAKEAYTSVSIGNYMAAILMARTVIEATAKASGITSGDLSKKINALRDKQLIRPSIADQAHEVRYFGNDMAHGDIEDAPDQLDAEEILALMGQVLNEVFQGPALMLRIRARRTGAAATQEA
ncbi:hypothetical protein C5C50_05290 [Rathayibacter sp. AY1D9]|nr:hypothetical protein C5C50_05290 [Rathayibacter sp. AY1D9]